MPQLRSRTTTHGRNMAGARALWRATGVKDEDFGKPIIAVVNSFTQFVPGHVHLKDMGQLVAGAIAEAGGIGREFNTIAVDDGIAGQQVFAGEATRLAYMTDEAVEGRDAFLEKRDPDWSPFPWQY